MADGSLVLCDVLCFLVNKFGSIGNKLLKPVIRDFYSSEALNKAKVRLLSDVNDINLIDTFLNDALALDVWSWKLTIYLQY